jgi:glutathione S-transferase
MKLYYTPGTCSLCPHIVAWEAGIPIELRLVNLKDKVVEGGEDYRAINPKGYVPALELDNGVVLTEVSAVTRYLADQNPDSGLVPRAGSLEHYRVQEWLSFISGELHKNFSPLIKPNIPDEYKPVARLNLDLRFDWLNKELAGRDYLVGMSFTIADAYLFTALLWADTVKMDLAKWQHLTAYRSRIGSRPKVIEALKAEGLMN